LPLQVDPEFDKTLDAARSTIDADARQKLYRQATDIYMAARPACSGTTTPGYGASVGRSRASRRIPMGSSARKG